MNLEFLVPTLPPFEPAGGLPALPLFSVHTLYGELAKHDDLLFLDVSLQKESTTESAFMQVALAWQLWITLALPPVSVRAAVPASSFSVHSSISYT